MSRRTAARWLIAIMSCAAILAVSPAAGAAASRAAPAPPKLPVTAAALYAPQTGQTLYAADADRRLAIASTTKLMTALVTLEHVHRLSTMFTQNDWYPSAVDSQIGLEPGERMSVHDLLLALMLPSADDAAEDLAYNVGHGSVGRFVAMMNAQARALGLHHTHYSTPIGLDTPGNYSSAADLVRLADYDMSHSAFFARIVGLTSAVLRSGATVRRVTNRNDLVGRYPWIDGVKTGHTANAGYVLVASGERGGLRLISAVLGTDSAQARDASTLALLDYGFGAFALRAPVTSGQVLARPAVEQRPGFRATVVAGAGFTRILPRGARVQVSARLPARLSGPLPAQAIVGSAVVLVDGRPVARIPLVLAQRLAPVSSLAIAARSLTRPAALLALLLVVAAGAGALLLWSARRRRRTVGRAGELEGA